MLAESFCYSSFHSVIYTNQHRSHLSGYCGNLKSGLLAELCLQFFFGAILEGEPRRFEPRPNLEVSKQTQLKLTYHFGIFHTIVYCVVVIMLITYADRPGSNLCVVTNFFYRLLRLFNHLWYNLYNFFLNIVYKLTKWEAVFKWKSIEN